jgi:hypothetical protein
MKTKTDAYRAYRSFVPPISYIYELNFTFLLYTSYGVYFCFPIQSLYYIKRFSEFIMENPIRCNHITCAQKKLYSKTFLKSDAFRSVCRINNAALFIAILF